MFENLAEKFARWGEKIPFDNLVWLTWGSFVAVFIAALTLSFALPSVRNASKRPFLCLVYAYTAVTLALFLLVNEVEEAAFVACIFWIAGYLLYAVLCLATKERKTPQRVPAQVAITAVPAAVRPMPTPVPEPVPVPAPKPAPAPHSAARTSVCLDHAIAVTAKLLEKNLAKTDRQELEKLKNTLEVMKVKGNLSPAEGEILNENFNTLLKLMAKYNI